MTKLSCSVLGCSRAHKAKGFCLPHYHRWRRWSDPLGGRLSSTASPLGRFNNTGWSETPQGCWEWNGSRFPRGYGQFSVNGKLCYAHRFAYRIHHGPFPSDLKILHRCDNPPCVNPEHLFLGTTQDNSDDMCRKGRSASGEQSGLHRLTDTQVLEIRRRYAAGDIRQRDLAVEFGTCQSNISLIVRHVQRRAITMTRSG